MDLYKCDSMIEEIDKDIRVLRGLMYHAYHRFGSLNEPLLVEISQYLDEKLNRKRELMKYYR